MKHLVKIAWLVGSIVLIVLIVKLATNTSDHQELTQHDIAPFLAELDAESDALYTRISPIGFNKKSHKEALILKKERWYVFSTSAGNLTYWNSNKFGLDSSLLHHTDKPALYTFGDDLYALFPKPENTYLAFRLANDGELHQKLLEYSSIYKDKELVMNDLSPYSSETKLTFQAKKKTERAFMGLALLASCLFLSMALWHSAKSEYLKYLACLAVISINLLTAFYLRLPFSAYFFLDNTSIESINSWQLIVTLYLHLAGIIAGSILVYTAFYKTTPILRNLLFTIYLLFLTDFILDLSSTVILRSEIPFDFEKLFSLNTNSFAALALICVYLISLWLFIKHARIEYSAQLKNWLPIGLGILLFILFQSIDAQRTLVSLAPPILLLAICLLINLKIKRPRWAIYAYFILTALLTATIIASNFGKRNKEIAKHYAEQLVDNEDKRAESILYSFENELAQEFLVPEDYQNFIGKKDLIESRIKHLYFSNYLEKYELKLLSFGSDSANVNASSLFDFNYLDSIFNNHSTRTSSAYFYQLDNASGLNGYIAKYENCDIEGHYGNTFILLQPRVVQSEFLYPEVFKNQENEPSVSLTDYSYGLYFNNNLVSQRGSFSYLLNALPDGTYSIFKLGEPKHYIYALGEYKVVLSKRENTLRAWLSTLTFTILSILFVGFMCSVFTYWFIDPEHSLAKAFLPFTNKYLSSRIQTSLTIILLAGLLLSVYINISFIQANYNENLEDQLLGKIKSISATLQNKVDLVSKLQNDEQRTLILNEESSTYNVDINLYSPAGLLLSSTKPYLTEDQILGRQMNPKAFVKLTQDRSSQLLIQEELEGSDYLSAYVPLFDGKNKVIGYVNTPFFAKNEELNKEISNLVVNIINIYFLLLLGGVFLAYLISRQISKPLLLIREKIAKTELGSQNELISYTREDEIGLLVKQYNKMVMELEESANQMAENEREGAWREMAKQVAHEIKNPLTPMKLSVQHLQRAYDSGPSEKLDRLFTKTSKLLIEQINSLSNMAGEFSNFAKLPEDKFEVFNLSEIVEKSVDLYRRSENIDLEASIRPDMRILADPEQIKRVLNNLLKNAIQAIPDGRPGKIHLELRNRLGAEISITDNGKGIPKENSKKVFVPNFSTKTSGMGLGLAMCKKIVETANGEIWFESEVDRGTTFTVRLPLHETT